MQDKQYNEKVTKVVGPLATHMVVSPLPLFYLKQAKAL